jgi:2-keto-4-pentenoate hydratase/2-oxohepta-3-ene-1,7-dioic acid hydratase in catechol pathway
MMSPTVRSVAVKLASFDRAGQRGVGVVVEGGLVELDGLEDMTTFLSGGTDSLETARRTVEEHIGSVRPLDTVRLLPPVPRPPKIICVARNYAEHAAEVGFELPTIPILFARFPVTLVAPGDPIVRPTVSEQLDWEGELAVIIGRGGRHITRDDALQHVAGYAIFNDVTVRDFQFRVAQYTAGKNFSASGPFGPWLTLTDEVPDPQALEIVTEVNGVEKQRANTADMIFDVATLIEHISEFVELEPGDVIPTGSPAGVGFKRDPPEFLRPGDICRIEISGLGALENPVVAEESVRS